MIGLLCVPFDIQFVVSNLCNPVLNVDSNLKPHVFAMFLIRHYIFEHIFYCMGKKPPNFAERLS